jgi:4-diphosphocytidyl-2-C-methyl-D-erythritol kinase
MITFPNCKINLGLHVTEKRPDGFHNVETVFYPLNWCDALEVLDGKNEEPFAFSQSGIPIHGNHEDNLVYKAWKLISEKKKLPPLRVHLHKNIPMGAGLGGGSADAAFFINLVNTKYSLSFNEEQKMSMASQLGSDCAFFINNSPVLASGKGDEFMPVHVDLSGYFIMVVYPTIHSNTREAYQGLTPKKPTSHLSDIISEPIESWKELLVNDFESTLFKKYPAIGTLKQQMYENGALYSAMSGSGSAVFGIFSHRPVIKLDPSYEHFLQKPASIIL